VVTFFLNFFAIIPLAPSINVLTRRLAELTEPGFGGILKVLLGNAVEIILRSHSVPDSFRSLTLLS
jgi:Ca2+/H+ antiporter